MDTAYGRLLLLTPALLPEDGLIEFQIQRNGVPIQVLLKSIDGKPFAPPGSEPGTAGPIANSAPAAAAAETTRAVNNANPNGNTGPSTGLSAGQPAGELAGIRLPPAPASVRLKANPATLEPGTILDARLVRPTTSSPASLRLSAPAAGAVAPIPTVLAGVPTPTGAIAPRPTQGLVAQSIAGDGPPSPNPRPATAWPARPHEPLRLQLVAIGGERAPAGANEIPGQVVGQRTSGQLLVDTARGLIALETRSAIATGTDVTFRVLAPPPAPPGPTNFANTIAEMFYFRQWPALDEAVAHMLEAAPAATQQFLTGTVPQANPQLTTNVLFFLSALRGSNLRQWLTGAPLRTLERERPELLGRINEDFGQMTRVFNDAPGADWRAALVPFLNGSALEQVRMYSRGRRGRNDEEEDEQDQSRFIIDVELSEIGRVQMDGLVRGKDKRFDLILRTDAPVPPAMRRDIIKIFTDSTEATGVAGTILFQGNREFVEILVTGEDAGARTGLVV